ncbi:hypothetical protein GFS31_33220 [Leptolyngbya sp. BL0902]|uniref:hypothetical protein n=1 Tax=Leptolyngbya sp. BL0902 TaxID=1115757 RepID=UPI0018E80555|nr:hypothetical protein [Leptolyngbya sp. BL0902]QQE66622.1 hypothetical protein GFS31_33220 [Leptolyngbya sp. BL0902]
MLRSLLTAFRQQYPQGGLVSELVQIHDGLYLVRVVVVVADQTLATGMAAHAVLETAEDTAYVRALHHMGAAEWGDGMPPSLATPPISPGASPTPLHGVSGGTETDGPVHPSQEPPRPSAPASEDRWPNVPPAPRSLPQPDDPGLERSFLDLDLSPVESATVPPENNGALASPSLAQDLLSFDGVPTPSIDLSDIIAQTDVELQRLGWNVNQGREFLEKTYGKRSRHELSDEELLEFLLFLETQPTPGP